MAKYDENYWHEWTDWRWSAATIVTVGGLHGSILLGFFALLFGAMTGTFPTVLVLLIFYAGYLIYCARQKRTPYRQLLALYVVHVQGAQWRSR